MGRVVNLEIDEALARALADAARAKDLSLDDYLGELLEQERQRRFDDIAAGLKALNLPSMSEAEIEKGLTEARSDLEARFQS